MTRVRIPAPAFGVFWVFGDDYRQGYIRWREGVRGAGRGERFADAGRALWNMQAGTDRVREGVKVIIANTGGDVVMATAGELLPGAFTRGMMKGEQGRVNLRGL